MDGGGLRHIAGAGRDGPGGGCAVPGENLKAGLRKRGLGRFAGEVIERPLPLAPCVPLPYTLPGPVTTQAALSEAGSAEIEAGQVQSLPKRALPSSRANRSCEGPAPPAPNAKTPSTTQGLLSGPHPQPCPQGQGWTKAIFFWTVHGPFSLSRTKKTGGASPAAVSRASPPRGKGRETRSM